EQVGLHPAMASLRPLWQQQELAVLQGVGYPDPNLSHFRSIEIWETASSSQQYLSEGWLSRLFREQPTPRDFAADGVVLSSQVLGPLDGGARAVVLTSPQDFARQAKLAADQGHAGTGGALGHILKVEGDIRQAAAELGQPAKPIAAA
ncbi:Twin-arginine translocation pathway signal sequence domain-containing protein, partial [Pseudomonas sp. MWU13-2860]